MHTRFLVGPAGSGKTHRCLAEIRAELAADPAGPPLLLLAPKQATFQLERQLLGEAELSGYTRLQILSFERLASFVLEHFAVAPAPVLDEEGRLMVLRALLVRLQERGELKLFHATARLPGFAQQLSRLLREFQRSQLSPERLRRLLEPTDARPLALKLQDVALLLRAYQDWLSEHGLQDVHGLPDEASRVLRRVGGETGAAPAVLRLGGVWLDGFAEITQQELDLLAALVPGCARATLAFCLEDCAVPETSWLSIWSVVGPTFQRCHQRLSELPGVVVDVEVLARGPGLGRFGGNPVLAHLEASWTNPQAWAGGTEQEVAAAIRVVTCPNPEAEAVYIARELVRHAQAGGRYRDAAVLLRSLVGYDDVLPRMLRAYDVPFFLDQRVSVAHHPLAELTRSALLLVAYDWRQADWLGALKTGLVPGDEGEVDWLENQALEHGWEGRAWVEPLRIAGDEWGTEVAERLRQQWVPPFQKLQARLQEGSFRVNGPQLAGALRGLWEELAVADTLQCWNDAPPGEREEPAIHLTVLEQLEAWLGNVERAFPDVDMTVREWLPILEAGLSVLTVGVIPPALDQVLIGAIDRSRNPDLQLVFLPGMNETVFPAAPSAPVILTEAERSILADCNVFLGPSARQRLGHERYFGYIACTRARQRLVLTTAAANERGVPLNPSYFIAHLERLFPQLTREIFSLPTSLGQEVHPLELIRPLLEGGREGVFLAGSGILERLPAVAPVLARWRQLQAGTGASVLTPGVVQRLYGPELRVSVHALESFAACPFKFLVARGLRAGERKHFEVDSRERGSFQHELLQEFHRRVAAAGKKWRDLTPGEARAWVGAIGEDLQRSFRHGLFTARAADQFAAQLLVEGAQTLVGVLVGWARQYGFDPYAVEVSFGLEEDGLPGWRLELSADQALVLRGRIDRVDIYQPRPEAPALAVVVDYKSSRQRLDPLKVQHGLQLQLLAYLGWLRQLAEARPVFGVSRLEPAGVFYVSLRHSPGSGATRDEVRGQAEAGCLRDYQHVGRFNADYLAVFDQRGVEKGDQFNYRITKSGALSQSNADPMPGPQFRALLDEVEGRLRQLGRKIYAGDVAVAPFKKGKETACDHCDYRSICRFDPWVESYRVLRSAGARKGEA